MNNPTVILDELLAKNTHDNEELEIILSQYANGIAAGDPNFTTNYYQKLANLFSSYEKELALAEGLLNLLEAITCFYQTKFNKTIEAVNKAISEFSQLKYNDLLGLCFMIKGANYRSLGEIDEAVKYLYKGIELISENGNVALYKCYCFYQLAEINVGIKDNQAARNNYLKAAEMAEKINNATGLFRAYNGLGNLFIVEENYPDALLFLNKTLAIKGVTDSERSRTFCDLGVYYAKVNDLEQSKTFYEQSVAIRKEANLMDAASTALIGLGSTLLALDLIEEAIEKLNEALEICKQFNSRQKLLSCFHFLAQAYQKNKEWELSVITYEQYDSIQQELSSSQLQKIYKLKNNQIEAQKQQIETILTEVHDSISYAKRIQQAILPSEALIAKNLPNSFVYYQPKDIVAGDFYWMHLLPEPNGWEVNGDTVLFAAADCTGHGVPGALVSVVCNNALNQAVKEFGITQPNLILDKTRELVIETFSESSENVKDGMDIALCSLNTKTNFLSYAGANNPIWIIRKDTATIEEIKADKQPVGNFELSKAFTSHTIELEKGDTLYIFSDGFVDQFGGPKGKKFKAKAFREVLLSIQDKSMEQQKTIINTSFVDWKGNLEQVDDVCVIGVKI